MKYLKISGLLILVALVGIQFIPTSLNQSEVVPPSDFMISNEVPEHIERKIRVSCYDCHSNNTEYPWYSTVQPMAWILEDHITEGKEELNFSEWDDYSSRKKRSKLRSVKSQIESNKMPLSSYTLLHRDAVISEKEKKMLLEWLETLEAR
ncbi:heme-binding domain-containing protein [Sinomicrobium weinanense]|uniref:Heme-binding domain-containing protein n=1 Tax=Sinomicrobium weinanense TaxID=2842200 RepID=A0A926JPA6_9FLAO|nr:heme-binding domain-containing protein [Sinomicrobium weinanense]MBC9794975.1 heme-binding domain-containing protein [Sinomicrobium weinanense]MBU3125164.1 heme-binding domain-containing protein [Sinomicrobium weinanense]